MSINTDNYKIFFLEDDLFINESLTFLLKQNFNEVHSFTNGKEAIDLLNKGYIPDFILTDINMPYVNGIDFIKECKKKNLDIPTIIISAHNEFDYAKSAINLGVKEYVSKPIIDSQALMNRMKNIIDNNKKESWKTLATNVENQFQIIIEKDSNELVYISNSFLDFLEYEDLRDFKDKHTCISELFLKDSSSFYFKNSSKKLWIEELLKIKEDKRIALFSCKRNNVNKAFNISIKEDKKHFIISFSNISSIFENQLELENKLIKDTLTSAYNREYFEQNIDSIILRTKKDGKYLAVILTDIDYFKKINDNFGHAIGDLVLKEFVKTLQLSLRESDHIIRWGGEEFLILMPTNSNESLKIIAEKVQDAPSNDKNTHILSYTCSTGATIYLENEDIHETIKRADKALYRAKNSGRNTLVLKE